MDIIDVERLTNEELEELYDCFVKEMYRRNEKNENKVVFHGLIISNLPNDLYSTSFIDVIMEKDKRSKVKESDPLKNNKRGNVYDYNNIEQKDEFEYDRIETKDKYYSDIKPKNEYYPDVKPEDEYDHYEYDHINPRVR